MDSMKVVLVEDHVSYRQSLSLALSELGPFTVVGECSTAREAYEVIARATPDLAVVDFMLPDTDGVSLARELRRRKIRARVMILGRLGHPLFVRDALRAGIAGFALKRQPLEELIDAMKKVASGQNYLCQHVRDALVKSDGDAALESLSAREREIFVMLLEGLSTKEIARSLFLSAKTVDAHRLHINRKLGVRSPAELARLVADEGFLSV
jgi:two-component system, NarL family, response regulator FusR